MLTIAVVEDEPRTRQRIADVVSRQPGWVLLGDAGTLAEARDLLRAATPDVLLLDIGLPDGSGLDLLSDLAALPDNTTGTLVVSVLGDERSVLRAIELGASGYLLKDADDAAIRAAIDELMQGGAPLSPSIAVHLMRRFQAAPGRSISRSDNPLSEREVELLRLIAKGLSYEEVGRVLGLKYNTVTSYAKEIYRKLQVHSRSEAVFEARQAGWMGPE